MSRVLRLQKLETPQMIGPMALSVTSCDSNSCTGKPK